MLKDKVVVMSEKKGILKRKMETHITYMHTKWKLQRRKVQ